MKKNTSKIKFLGSKKDRTDVLLEEIRSEVRVSAEQTSDILKMKPVVEKLSEDMNEVKMKVDLIIGSLKEKASSSKVDGIDSRLKVVERRILSL